MIRMECNQVLRIMKLIFIIEIVVGHFIGNKLIDLIFSHDCN